MKKSKGLSTSARLFKTSEPIKSWPKPTLHLMLFEEEYFKKPMLKKKIRHSRLIILISPALVGVLLACIKFVERQAQPTAADRFVGQGCSFDALEFSPDGRFLAGVGQTLRGTSDVYLWDMRTKKARCKITYVRPVRSVDFASDSNSLAVGRNNGSVQIWDTSNCTLKTNLSSSGAPIEFVTFAENMAYLLSQDSDATVKIWRMQDRSGRHLARPMLLRTIKKAKGIIPFGKNDVVTLSNLKGKDGQLQSILSQKLVGPPLHSDPIYDLAVSPDRRWIAGEFNDEIHIWNALSGVDYLSIAAPKLVRNLVFSFDGKLLAVHGAEEVITLSEKGISLDEWSDDVTIWDVDKRRQIFTLSEPQAISFSPNGHILATAKGSVISLWDLSHLM